MDFHYFFDSQDQIFSHVHRDVSLQVYMYYGPERLRDVKFLREQDIVLTTYQTLTNDNRHVSIPGLPCKYYLYYNKLFFLLCMYCYVYLF